MAEQLVPAELLRKADKILFVAHLALGDFTYMQNCFRAFQRAYPHIRMHLWVDEVRRTADASQWEHLRKYALYDWVRACGMFDRIYDQTYSPQLYAQSIEQARAEDYPVVVSFAVLRRHLYAELVRKLSPRGFVVGQKKRVRLLDIRKHLAYRKLDAFIPAYASRGQEQHISAIYAGWFESLFGLTIPAEADRIKLMRPVLAAAGKAAGFSDVEVADLELAASEAAENIILHAYREGQRGDITLAVHRLEDGLMLRIRDFAPKVDQAKIHPRPLDEVRPGGLGTHFIRAVMDDANFIPLPDGEGNLLELVKRRKKD